MILRHFCLHTLSRKFNICTCQKNHAIFLSKLPKINNLAQMSTCSKKSFFNTLAQLEADRNGQFTKYKKGAR